MLPVIFGENLFDDLFDDAFSMRPLYDVNNALYGKHAKQSSAACAGAGRRLRGGR